MRYNVSGTDEGLLRDLTTRDKEWLSGFSVSRLRGVADLLHIPKKGIKKPELEESIYNHRHHEYSDFYINKWDYWLRDGSFKGAVRVYSIGLFSATDLLKQLTESRAAVKGW